RAREERDDDLRAEREPDDMGSSSGRPRADQIGDAGGGILDAEGAFGAALPVLGQVRHKAAKLGRERGDLRTPYPPRDAGAMKKDDGGSALGADLVDEERHRRRVADAAHVDESARADRVRLLSVPADMRDAPVARAGATFGAWYGGCSGFRT